MKKIKGISGFCYSVYGLIPEQSFVYKKLSDDSMQHLFRLKILMLLEVRITHSFKQFLNLIEFIQNNYEIDFTMICHYSGEVLTSKKKYSRMLIEDMGSMENILDW